MIQFNVQDLINQYSLIGLPALLLVFATLIARFKIRG